MKILDLISREIHDIKNPTVVYTYPSVDFADTGVTSEILEAEPTQKTTPDDGRCLAWVLEEESATWWPSEIIE
jgi:hypothetical protein